MSTISNHYQTLGVMREAEQVVITAAYRALASRYHPDRWKGDPAEATFMMSKINVAYGILGDIDKRNEYDKSVDSQRSTTDGYSESAERVFDDAAHEYDDRWQTACSIYPDLAGIRSRLSKISRLLAFNYVVQLMETRKFESRVELAKAMEKIFLESRFGVNPEIVDYAKFLIEEGYRDAVKLLNHLVDVMGSDVESKRVIAKVEEACNLSVRRAVKVRERAKEEMWQHLLNSRVPQPSVAIEYARVMGYELEGRGLFFRRYSIRKLDGEILFSSSGLTGMIDWIVANIPSKDTDTGRSR